MPLAVGLALVPAHDADPAEADLLVGADRARVLERGIDRQAVVAAHVEEPAREQPHRLGAEAAVLERGAEVDVDARVAVVGVELLGVLDPAGDLTADVDDEQDRVVVVAEQLRLELVPLLRLAPPTRDARLGEDREQRLDVVGPTGPDGDAVTAERGPSGYGAVRSFATNAAYVKGMRAARKVSTASA